MPATGNIGLRAILDMTNMDSNSKEFLSRLNILNRGVDSFAKNSSGSLREATNQTGLLGEAFHRVAAIVNGIIIADIFRGRIVDVSIKSVMVEVTGTPDKIAAFIDLASKFGIMEIARTGVTALERGE